MLQFVISDGFALAVLALIFLNIRKTRGYLIEQKLFMVLIAVDAFILLLDMGMWFLDGMPGASTGVLYNGITVLYYLCNPLICLIWYFYVDYQLFASKRRMKRLIIPLLIPALLVGALAVMSVFKGYLFYIDGGNVYHRGPLFPLMALISLFYLVLSIVVLIAKRSGIEKKDFYSMLFFSIPALAGGVIQSLVYGISLVWICATFSALVIFVNMQNSLMYTDYLTGLFNRRQLDNFLRQNGQPEGGLLLAGIMIDLDFFKAINDRFGHNVGDQALHSAAGILKRTFRHNDFISRYGGDEFLVLLTVRDFAELEKAVSRLEENVKRFNEQKSAPYELSFSIGYDCLCNRPEADMTEFLKHIDELMYKSKQEQGKSV